MRQRLRAFPGLLLVCLVMAWVVWHGIKLMRVDAMTLSARQQIEQWTDAGVPWMVPQWIQAQTDLQAALAVAPEDPVLQDITSQLYVMRGMAAWADDAQREAFFSEALHHQEASLRSRSQNGAAWANLAFCLYVLEKPMNEFHQAWETALRLAPNESVVQNTLMDLALLTWDQATPTMRAWVRQQYHAGQSDKKNAILMNARKYGREDVLY